MPSFQEFRQRLAPFVLFSIKEIEKHFPDFDSRRLVEWQKKEYIRKVRNRFYRFNDPVDESLRLYAANRLYSPSYISLESALSYYNWIPEAVFQITSCSTNKTERFDTELGSFSYRRVKPALFWGYKLINTGGYTVRFAEPEKTLIDYLYLHSQIHEMKDLDALRWNPEAIRERISMVTLNRYESHIGSSALSRRLQLLYEFIHAAT